MWDNGPLFTEEERQARVHGAELDALSRVRILTQPGMNIPPQYIVGRIQEIITDLDNTIKELS